MTEDSTPLPPFSKSSSFNLGRIPAWLPIAFYTITAISIPWVVEQPEQGIPGSELNQEEAQMRPWEHAWMMRAWPDTKLNVEGWDQAMEIAAADEKQALTQLATAKGGAVWQSEGPTNIGGRVNTIAVDPSDANIVYAGSCNGGIHKTVDGGATWVPLFDSESHLAIGDIEIDPNNPNTVYAGTGDPNITGFPFVGNGVYKSTDGGGTWTPSGLSSGRIISRIEVHPSNSNLLYAGAMGLPFEKNSDRGLYKSLDAGATWNQVFYVNDSTGVIDMVIDPTDPDRIWVTTWNRLRSQFNSVVLGPDAGVWRSTDGGASWTQLGGGLPTGWQCRPGIYSNPSNPDHLVVQYVSTSMETEGVYESFDGGNSWTPLGIGDLGGALGGFGWYFAKVRMNPFNPTRKYVLGVSLWWTDDGGSNWDEMTSPWGSGVHADKHDMVFLGLDEILLATDGGIYYTSNHGTSWTRFDDIPNTQFYHAEVNPHQDGDYWGGTQDNGTIRGNMATADSWDRMLGGDGFHVEFHKDNPDIIWAEYQNGGLNRSTDGGFSFSNATDGIMGSDRRNWDFPFILSPHNSDRAYAGTYRLYRSEGSVVDFSVISPDLTKGILTFSGYHTLSTMRESAIDEGQLYTGSSDGRVMRSDDGGFSWLDVSAGLPNRYVTDIETSAQDIDRLFVTHTGYKENDNTPLIHRSDDRGASWTSIAGDLPPIAINDMEAYPGNEDILFVATDGGVYFSLDGGADWERLGAGMPIVTVADIAMDFPNGKLIAGTHARSMMSIELADITPSQLAVTPPSDATICEGEALEINVPGALVYSWSPTAGLSCSDCADPVVSPSATTTYAVTVTDGLGHEEIYDFTITVIPEPDLPVISISGDTLYSTGAGSSWEWYLDGVSLGIGSDDFFVPDVAGNYSVQMITPEGCESGISTSVNWTPALGIPTLDFEFSLAPNPVSSATQLSWSGSKQMDVSVLNLEGREVLRYQNASSPLLIDCVELPAGNYWLRALDPQSGTSFRRQLNKR